MDDRKRHEGIVVKQRANGTRAYMAHVWDARAQKRVRKTFSTLAAAKGCRADATAQMRQGVSCAPSTSTVAQAGDAWLSGARDGSIRNRSGDVYKPSAIRGYEQALRLRLLNDFGGRKLSEMVNCSRSTGNTSTLRRALSGSSGTSIRRPGSSSQNPVPDGERSRSRSFFATCSSSTRCDVVDRQDSSSGEPPIARRSRRLSLLALARRGRGQNSIRSRRTNAATRSRR